MKNAVVKNIRDTKYKTYLEVWIQSRKTKPTRVWKIKVIVAIGGETNIHRCWLRTKGQDSVSGSSVFYECEAF